jgi:hypothetical protein
VDLVVSDVQIRVFLIGVSAPFFEKFIVVVSFEMLPAQWAIGSLHESFPFLSQHSDRSTAERKHDTFPHTQYNRCMPEKIGNWK